MTDSQGSFHQCPFLHSDPLLAFVVEMDASENSIGMILSHHGDPHGPVTLENVALEHIYGMGKYCPYLSRQNLCSPNYAETTNSVGLHVSWLRSCRNSITLQCHTAHKILLSMWAV